MAKNTFDKIRSWISLSLLTIGVIIIVLGAIRGFEVEVFDIIFQRPVPEQQASAIVGLGTAFTFVAIWLQRRPFARFKKGLGL